MTLQLSRWSRQQRVRFKISLLKCFGALITKGEQWAALAWHLGAIQRRIISAYSIYCALAENQSFAGYCILNLLLRLADEVIALPAMLPVTHWHLC